MVAWLTRRMLAGVAFAALLVAALLATAVAGARPRHAAAPTAVGVSEREFRVAVYRPTLPPGSTRFNVANDGEDIHDLVVRTAGGRTVARVGKLGAGERASVQVKLTPGTYRLVCTLADHARRGMRATIRVEAPRKRGDRN